MDSSEIGLLAAIFVVLILVFVGAYFALSTTSTSTPKQMTSAEIAEELAITAALNAKKAKAVADAQKEADAKNASDTERANMIASIQAKYDAYGLAVEAAKPTVYKIDDVTITTSAKADGSYSVQIDGPNKTVLDVPAIGQTVANAPFMGYTQVITTLESKTIQGGIHFEAITTQGLAGGKIDVTTIAYDVPAPVYNRLPPP